MKQIRVKNTKHMAELLGLSETHAIEAELKTKIMAKIKETIEAKGLTHQEVADLSGLGRTVITGIVNFSIQRITLDRLIRVLVSLGITPEVKFKKSA
jgi:predicted XRE-type DNA-binding protein